MGFHVPFYIYLAMTKMFYLNKYNNCNNKVFKFISSLLMGCSIIMSAPPFVSQCQSFTDPSYPFVCQCLNLSTQKLIWGFWWLHCKRETNDGSYFATYIKDYLEVERVRSGMCWNVSFNQIFFYLWKLLERLMKNKCNFNKFNTFLHCLILPA